MSSEGPTEGDEGDRPFDGMPFFGDLARLLQNQGPVSWDAARQLALSIAAGGASEPNIDPLERMKIEELGRVADLHVAESTGLSTTATGSGVHLTALTRTAWAQRSLDAYRPLFEQLAETLHAEREQPTFDESGEYSPDDPLGFLAPLMRMIGPMMLGMTAGSMVGHLAQRTFGQYDLPLPRPGDEIGVVLTNLNEFEQQWSLPRDDLRLWICVHDIAHHAVLAVPHVRRRLEEYLRRYLSGFEPDPHALESRLSEIDVASSEGMQSFHAILSDPEVLLGAMRSPEQRELLPRLEALVAAIVGYVDHVMDTVGDKLHTSWAQVTEAVRRRRVKSDPSDRFAERLLGLELSQTQYDRGAAFVQGVLERAGDDGLRRLWHSERELPTPAEVDAPGLWLARIDLPHTDE